MCTAGAKRPPPIIHQLRSLLATEGFRGFFKGNAANCLKVAPTKGIQFVAFESFKRLFHRARQNAHPDSDPSTPLSPGERFLAGGLAGIVAATVCYPLDTAKTLLTTHPEKFAGVFSTMASVSRTHGLKGLYRGLSPTVIAMMPYAGLDFAIYEQMKMWYAKKKGREADLLSMLFIGAFAGAVAQTACHPLDVLRKRLQLQGLGGRPIQYRSMFDAARSIIKDEGFGSMFRGLQPMYISAIPSAGVSYVVYEVVKRTLGVRSFQ